MVSATKEDSILPLLEPFIFELTSEYGGSISAEHGLGRMKASEIGYSKGPASVAVMRALKETFDPRGILNPYKVLPPPREGEVRWGLEPPQEGGEETSSSSSSSSSSSGSSGSGSRSLQQEREFTDQHADQWGSWAASRVEARGGVAK